MNSDWPDRKIYPFEAHYLETSAGRMHYLDEGTGEAIVFVHGTPTWSFLWRHLIADLRRDFRCVAPDHLGFGLSDKPPDADYTPEAHARNLGQLITSLGLRNVTLVVHDFGGPIGLACALRNPDNVSRVVLMNTWLWSNAGNRSAEAASRLLSGRIGHFLYTRLNFSPRVLLKNAYADRSRLTPEVHRHYLAPFSKPAERLAPWILARELTGSNDWYDSLWQQREKLQHTPMLILWGMADRLFGPAQLQRWQAAFPRAGFVPLEGVGHFVAEEAPEQVIRHMREFLRDNAQAVSEQH
jgi:haloalkane dehalogenase